MGCLGGVPKGGPEILPALRDTQRGGFSLSSQLWLCRLTGQARRDEVSQGLRRGLGHAEPREPSRHRSFAARLGACGAGHSLSESKCTIPLTVLFLVGWYMFL